MLARWFLPVILAYLAAATIAPCQQSPALTPDAKIETASTSGIRSYEIRSGILGETRRIFVSLPTSFEKSASGRTYPVIVVVDGEELTSPVSSVSEHLSRMGQIPESIIVGIENTNRLRDLTPPGLSVSGSSMNEGGDRFIDFIEKELLPAIDRQFRGGLPRTFVGHSSGGILGTYIAATRPAFSTVVAIDTPVHLGDNWLAERLMKRISAANTPPVRYVSLEARFGWSDVRWKALTDAAPATWKLHREKLTHESHESMTMLASYIGLREAFADYSALAAPVSPTTSIVPSYAKLTASFGVSMIPPRRILANAIEDMVSEGRGKEARQALTTLINSYGAPSNVADLEAMVADAERRPPPTVTVESLLATPFSTPTEAKPYVGEWVGDLWMSADEPRNGRQTLRIKVENGRVVGETVHHLPDGEDMVQEWTYFRITKTGLTFGYMNGMRPRGMLLHEGNLKGDTLSGTMNFGGVNFTRPDGSKPPTIYFAYRKVK